MTDELTACLAGYVEQASLDSSGQFTLSAEKSLEKLKNFSLAEPRLYVLNALAAAQSAGARSIAAECDADDTILHADTDFDFGPYLKDLSHRLLDDKSPPAVRELAMAFHAAKGLNPGAIEVVGGSQRLRWSPDGREVVEPFAGQGLRLHVHERLGLRTLRKAWSYRWGEVRLDTEEDALKRHCNLTPLPTRINGQPLARPLDLGECQHHLFSGCRDLDSQHPLARCLALRGARARSQPGPYPVVLAEGGRLPPYLVLVVRGVNYRMPAKGVDTRDFKAIAYVDHLRKDLSQTQLVQDQDFKGVLTHIGRLLRDMRKG
ncbi:MAG: hypothetical protein J0I12_17285 [Candidatus Eremiobacteraeota bacterium]|nr:hypothetical protein [Candidatus Eremiobacteraeota bacterium]